ncbi:hypothetical protein SRHO_G00221790 [Serrasalmus rhombeus]
MLQSPLQGVRGLGERGAEEKEGWSLQTRDTQLWSRVNCRGESGVFELFDHQTVLDCGPPGLQLSTAAVDLGREKKGEMECARGCRWRRGVGLAVSRAIRAPYVSSPAPSSQQHNTESHSANH